MEKEKKQRHLLRWILPGALLLLAAVMLILIVGSRSVSENLDDPEAILAAYDPASFGGLTLREDGSIRLRLEKRDLYSFAEKSGLAEDIAARLREDRFFTSAGFRITGGHIVMSLTRRAGGILPLSYRAYIRVFLEGNELCLRADKVTLGTRTSLRQDRWPTVLRRELRLDLSEAELPGELVTAELVGSSLEFTMKGLWADSDVQLTPETSLTQAIRLFGASPDTLPETIRGLIGARDGQISASEAMDYALGSGHAREAAAQLLALCTAESVDGLRDGDGELWRSWLWEPLEQSADTYRQRLDAFLSSRQKEYEKLLFSARELYRSGSLGIENTGFFSAATGDKVHPGTLSRLNVTATDSRIVFLTSSVGEVGLEDMPAMIDVPRRDWITMDRELDWKMDVDLGVLITTEGGVPILLYRRGDGTLVFRQVTDSVYVAALVSRPIPQINVDDLEPVEEARRSSGESFTGAVLGFLPLGDDGNRP